jgi:predicted RNA-binding protein Jag
VNDVIPPSAVPATVVAVDLRAKVTELLSSIFSLMKYPATLEFKDMPDGALGVAVNFEGELPGITPGKRSYLVDCIQFLVNKAINRPNVPRRWVNLGINAFPEPRVPGQPLQKPEKDLSATAPRGTPAVAKPPKEQAPKDSAPRGGKPAPAAAPAEKSGKHDKVAREPQPPRGNQRGGPDEKSMEVSPNPTFTAAGELLAKKAVQHGRIYAVMMLPPDDRARVLQAAAPITGLSTKAEGEGHWRRVTFTPEKVTPILKRQIMPDYDDEEDDDDAQPTPPQKA